jgi:hypothetical protein
VHSGRESSRDHASLHRRKVESSHAELTGAHGRHGSKDLGEAARALDREIQGRNEEDGDTRRHSDAGISEVAPPREAPSGAGSTIGVPAAGFSQPRDSSTSRWGE